MNVRQQKLEAQIQRMVGVVLARDVSDPRLSGLISVTRVCLTPDWREARVFVSVLSPLASSTVMHGLKAAESLVQRRVAQGLNRRMAPRLSFHLDESLKRQSETLRLLDHLRNQTGDVPSDDVPADGKETGQ